MSILPRLHHPHIARLFDYMQSDDHIYFAFEKTKFTLADVIRNNGGHLDEAKARKITYQITEAIEYLQLEKVYHRNLKPSNILLDGKYRVKLSEFGCGRRWQVTNKMATTVVGTPIYMAPEVLIKEFRSGGNGYDERADMWSMAVILY